MTNPKLLPPDYYPLMKKSKIYERIANISGLAGMIGFISGLSTDGNLSDNLLVGGYTGLIIGAISVAVSKYYYSKAGQSADSWRNGPRQSYDRKGEK